MREPTDTVSRRLRHLRAAGDRGSASLFLAVVAIAVLVAIGLVIDGGYALADRQSAANAAEQAARAGADAVNPASLRSSGPARVDPARARAAANRVLAELGRTGAVAVAGDRVTVTVTITRRTAILSVVGLTTLRVTGHATATGVPGLSTVVGGP